ncbi:MAG: murein biosynthesis integral membrane protein MurJ [Candidatus Bipolaricaulis anaerobius]|nr:murein biosynthesis integral membrane protein MurJ [Candidatus Bipolaricaulis anaerobius]MDD5764517.1 murein biosynthesis integral membrane protein MurJ [Candidatus Bipolaricaulis anaerobius]
MDSRGTDAAPADEGTPPLSPADVGGGSFLGDVLRGASGTIVSRLAGLVRDAAIAYAFGASAGYDAFLVALFIPQALRQVLGEGGIATAFLPVYAQARERGEGDALARSAFVYLFLLLPILCALGVLFAPSYVPVLAAGFAPETMAQSVALARWMFPLIGFISLAALAGGILNAHGRFFLPALAPAMLNGGMLLGAVALSRVTDPPVLGLALGSLIGGAGMFLLLLPPLRPLWRGPWKLWPPHPALGGVAWRLLPAIGALMVAELNTLVDNRLASYLAPGSIATLQYAMRLFQLPLGILAVSVTTAALPRLSRLAARSDTEGFRQAVERGFLTTAALILPALAGLLVLGSPILTVLFERGSFTAADTARTYAALAGYLSGLWAYALVYLFSRAWFALGRPHLPVLAGAIALVVNVGLNLWWVRVWGTFGLALATGVAGWVDALLLGLLLWRRCPGWVPIRKIGRLALAVGGMTGALLLLRPFLSAYGPWVAVGVGVPGGVALYAALAWILGITRSLAGGR